MGRFTTKFKYKFFQTFKWQKYWHEKCGNNLVNIITMVYKNDELISILPFNIKKIKIIEDFKLNGFPFSDFNQPVTKQKQKH